MPLVEAYINLQQSAALGSSSEAYAFTLAQAEMRDLTVPRIRPHYR
jgi:hypothetical protein